jgi:hypothetical protein
MRKDSSMPGEEVLSAPLAVTMALVVVTGLGVLVAELVVGVIGGGTTVLVVNGGGEMIVLDDDGTVVVPHSTVVGGGVTVMTLTLVAVVELE